jgi:lysophospholipase L1-like esterase
MSRPRIRFFLAAGIIGSLLTVVAANPAEGATTPPPNSMAALGDSITRGFDACGFFSDCPSASFATGTSATIHSHYSRILAGNTAISGHANNDAKTGAKAADLNGQAQTAVGQNVQYVTVLTGANDACTSTEAGMTAVATFRSQIDAAMATLRSGLPSARVLVISIPDIKRLWEIGKGSSSARTVWALGGICKSMLANPTSTAAADVARRDRVRQRVVDFNTQLAQACAAYGSNCLYDNNAVFNYQFVLSQVSTWDYFHPNMTGQSVLASVTYAAGFGW